MAKNDATLNIIYPLIDKSIQVIFPSIDKITVREANKIAAAKASKDHPPGGLYLNTQHSQEILLEEEHLFAGYDIYKSDAVLVYKELPQLVTFVFTQKILIDKHMSGSELLPYLAETINTIKLENLLVTSNHQSSLNILDFTEDTKDNLLNKSFKELGYDKLADRGESLKEIIIICPDSSENIPLISKTTSAKKNFPKRKR